MRDDHPLEAIASGDRVASDSLALNCAAKDESNSAEDSLTAPAGLGQPMAPASSGD
jgi:hypothetical protein